MTRDEELAEISKMMKEYKSMPSCIEIQRRNWFYYPVVERRNNWRKTELYHRIEIKMKTFDMKDKYR